MKIMSVSEDQMSAVAEDGMVLVYVKTGSSKCDGCYVGNSGNVSCYDNRARPACSISSRRDQVLGIWVSCLG